VFEWRNSPEADVERIWQENREALTLAGAALRDQTGIWPRNVGVLVLPEATLVCRAGRHLPYQRVLAEAAERLRKPMNSLLPFTGSLESVP